MPLATEILTTLKHIDTMIHELVQRAVGNTAGISENADATLMSLARHLSPKGVAKRSRGVPALM
jgi:hypothetical protein